MFRITIACSAGYLLSIPLSEEVSVKQCCVPLPASVYTLIDIVSSTAWHVYDAVAFMHLKSCSVLGRTVCAVTGTSSRSSEFLIQLSLMYACATEAYVAYVGEYILHTCWLTAHQHMN